MRKAIWSAFAGIISLKLWLNIAALGERTMDVAHKHKATIEKVSWKEVRDDVIKVNQRLGEIIDKLSPDDSFSLFKARYPFGSKIVDMGVLQLPGQDGKVHPINSPSIPSNMKDNLQRRSIPPALMLKKLGEMYYATSDRVICLNLFSPGFIFGLWENLDPPKSYYVKSLWSVSSGARSLYLLPKITDAVSHKELRKKYGVRSHLPRNLTDQGQIFVEIAHSQAFGHEWHSEILFFSDKWMDTATKDPQWREFYNFMLQDGWNQSQYWRNKVTFDIIWESFINQLIRQNIKTNPYLVSIVKHIVLVGTGVLPAFSAATEDSVGPILGLQQVLIEDYKLRDYVPTFMQPQTFALEEQNLRFVYYSLQQPILLETQIVTRRLPSVLNVMPEIAFLVDAFNLEVNQGNIRADNTPITTFADRVICDYFHNEANGDISGIRSTSEMPKEDKALLNMPKEFAQRSFAETSRFIRGCIRFSIKK